MNIALIGYGKMGKAIEQIALQRGHTIVLKITSANTQDLTPDNVRKADVAIEFTGPDTVLPNLMLCASAGMPVVCGSTGWNKKLQTIERLFTEHQGALVHASNFSVGVNIFFEINRKLASLMNGRNTYSVSLEETHHTAKKDAPSGTAISLAEQIIHADTRYRSWVCDAPAGEGAIPIHANRIDLAPGTHQVQWTSRIDDIVITHTAHNRDGFAEGAVLAAEFLMGKKGVFTMKDVLGL
ncbi:MAG TPA: 4-hydroxy-tetrahydrodipicolinate reductase [Ferruginibacter sp.]|nr:4-hydroxy-tetrahydrodipicolinate reductase [Ferruginibacter sp.]HRO17920.1 4-hydroxy-tetrahydrodipicolinate reductase [Ferruginibacter sp.]HRQ21064.1 4-hydroxy-tetrahydrodipicolinate reductase [Ferruginibacter sp.]